MLVYSGEVSYKSSSQILIFSVACLHGGKDVIFSGTPKWLKP